MALDRLINVTFTASGDGSGNQTISLPTGVGTPVGAFVEGAAVTGVGVGNAATHGRISAAVTDGTRTRCNTGYSEEHAIHPPNHQAQRFSNNTDIIHIRDMAGGVTDYARLAGTPFDTDEVNIVWNGGSDPSSAWRCVLTVVVGDHASAEANNHTSATSTGSEALDGYIDMVEQPELLVVISAQTETYPASGSDADDWAWSAGWCRDTGSSLEQACRGFNYEHDRSAGPRTGSYTSAIATPRVTGGCTPTGSDLGRLEVTTMDTNAGRGRHGVTLRDVTGTAVEYAYLAVSWQGWSDLKVDVWQIDLTTTGNKSYSNAGFRPDFLKAVQSNMNSADENSSTNINRGASCGLGGVDDAEADHACNTFTQRNTATPSNAGTVFDTRLFNVLSSSGGVAWQADFVSFDSDGFTMDVTDEVSATKSIPMLLSGPHLPLVPTMRAEAVFSAEGVLGMSADLDGEARFTAAGVLGFNLAVTLRGEALFSGGPGELGISADLDGEARFSAVGVLGHCMSSTLRGEALFSATGALGGELDLTASLAAEALFSAVGSMTVPPAQVLPRALEVTAPRATALDVHAPRVKEWEVVGV